MLYRFGRGSWPRMYFDDPTPAPASPPAPAAPAAPPAPVGDDQAAALATAQAELAALRAQQDAVSADLAARSASLQALEAAMSTDINAAIAAISDEPYRAELTAALQGRPVLDQRAIVSLVQRALSLGRPVSPAAPAASASAPAAPPPPGGGAPGRPQPAKPDPAQFVRSAAHRVALLRDASRRAQ